MTDKDTDVHGGGDLPKPGQTHAHYHQHANGPGHSHEHSHEKGVDHEHDHDPGMTIEPAPGQVEQSGGQTSGGGQPRQT